MDTMTVSIDDYRAELRQPLIDSDYRRDILDKMPKERRERVLEDMRVNRLKPLKLLIEQVINVMDEQDAKILGKMLARMMHRTLVQTFCRSVIVPFLQAIKEDGDNGFVDARNQATYEFAKRVLDSEVNFPFI